MPVFLLKKGPSFARLFSNMGSSEELGTLDMPQRAVMKMIIIILICYCDCPLAKEFLHM